MTAAAQPSPVSVRTGAFADGLTYVHQGRHAIVLNDEMVRRLIDDLERSLKPKPGSM